MATATVNPALLLSGPGILYSAPLGTAEPTHTPTAGTFPTTAWGGGWLPVGSTDAGSEFSDNIATAAVQVAESYYDIKYVTTGHTAMWKASLAEINTQNLKLALNGPTPTVTGSTGTTLTRIAPPTIGTEVRVMLGWQSQDDTVRFIGFQAFQQGTVTVALKKGADKAVLPLEWHFEKPAGDPYAIYLAGTGRA